MWLKRISILNYKNLEQAELAFSRKMNCIIGKNGMGKTNLMGAVYSENQWDWLHSYRKKDNTRHPSGWS